MARNGVPVERYRYDAFGRRSVIETADPGSGAGAGGAGVFTRTAIANDGSDRTLDLRRDADGTTVLHRRYTHSDQVDDPVTFEAFAQDGTFTESYTYHADHLGSIRFVTDSVGEIVGAYEYDSYGRPGVTLEAVAQPFRYTGREWDAAAELYHYRARGYDPETGRFLQEDLLLFGAGDLNVQAYVTQNPVNANDPYGLSAVGRSGASQVAGRSSTGQAKLGMRLACKFGQYASIFEVLDGPGSATQKIEAKNCGANAIKQTTKSLRSCKVTPGGGASSVKRVSRVLSL